MSFLLDSRRSYGKKGLGGPRRRAEGSGFTTGSPAAAAPPRKIFLYSYSTILYLDQYLKWPYRVCYSSL